METKEEVAQEGATQKTEVTPAEVTQTEEATPKTEVAQEPQVIPLTKYQELEKQYKETEAALEHTKSSQRGSDKQVKELRRELARVRSEKDSQQAEALSKKIDLLLKDRAGTLDETKGDINQQMARIEQEAEAKKQALLYTQHAEESLEKVNEILQEIGLDITSNDPDIVRMGSLWNQAIQSGNRLDPIIQMVQELKNKRTEAKVESIDVNKLKDELRQEIIKELHEQGKTNPDLKVETGGPNVGGSDDDTFLDKYGRGESDDHARASKILDKRRKGG